MCFCAWRVKLFLRQVFAAAPALLFFSVSVFASKTVTETTSSDFSAGEAYNLFVDSANDNIRCENRWTHLAGSVGNLYGCKAASEDDVILFGGKTSTSSEVCTNATFSLDTLSGEWNALSVFTSPSGRMAFAMAGDGEGSIVLFGGWDGSKVLDDSWIFSNGNWHSVICSTHPSARLSASLVSLGGGKLLLFGGKSGGNYFNDAWIFDNTSPNKWELVNVNAAELTPSPRAECAASPAGAGKVLIYGGEAGGNYLDDCWIYESPATFREIDVGASNPGKRAFAGMVYDADINRAVLYGGENEFWGNITYNQQLWIFNPSDEKWTQIYSFTPHPPARKYHAFCFVPSYGAVLYGGETDEPDEIFSDTWRYVVYSSGVYISKIYDTGSSVNPVEYKNLWWYSSDAGEVKFQLAASSNTDNFVFTGPDGQGSYYSASPVVLDSSRDSLRYFREKIIVSCESEKMYGFSFNESNLKYNHKPAAPIPYALLLGNGDSVSEINAKFRWWNASDPDGDSHTYEVRVGTSSDFSVYNSSAGIPEEYGTGYSYYDVHYSTEGRYFWKVRAADDYGDSDFSETWSFYVDKTAPSKVSDLAAEKVLSERGAVKLKWTSPGDDGTIGNIVDGICRIRYKKDSKFSIWWGSDLTEISFSTSIFSGRRTDYTVRGLADGATYYFAVAMEDEARDQYKNLGGISNSASAMTDSPPSVSVEGLSYLEVIKGDALFKWSLSDTDAGDSPSVDLFFSTDSGKGFVQIAWNIPDGTTTFMLNTLLYENSDGCALKAEAYDTAGAFDVSVSTLFILRNDNYAPSVSITHPSSGEVIGGSYSLNWTISDKNATDTHLTTVYISSDEESWDALIEETAFVSYTLNTMLFKSGVYFLKVVAKDSGNPPRSAAEEVEFQIYNENTPPKDFSLLDPASGSILNYTDPFFSWEAASDDEGDSISYTVYVSSYALFSNFFTFFSTGNSYQSPALSDGIYFWKVRAQDARGMEKESAETFSFSVAAGSFTVVGIFPANGSFAENVSSVCIRFNNPLDGERAAGAVSVSEDGEVVDVSISTAANVMVIYRDFPASREVTVSLLENFSDADGEFLTGQRSFKFRTVIPSGVEKEVSFAGENLSVKVSSSAFDVPCFISVERDYSSGGEAKTVYENSGAVKFLNNYSLAVSIKDTSGKNIIPNDTIVLDFALGSSNGYAGGIASSDVYVFEYDDEWKKAAQSNSGEEIKVYARKMLPFSLAGMKSASSAVTALRNIPNPFGEKTALWFDNPSKTEAGVKIYALNGEKVFSRIYGAAEVPVVWYGTDKNGRKLPDGMYILEVEASGRKMKKLLGIVR